MILNNQRGVALLMVTTAITLLTAIMVSFSFDSNLNLLRSYNIEDKTKAKLTAESGLRFAMARLRLYQEAYNFIQMNDGAKDIAKPEMINTIWNFPFVFPIPVTDKMNQIQKTAIKDFKENALIEGNLQLTIDNLSNKTNINLLRISLIESAKSSDENNEGEPPEIPEEQKSYTPDQQLSQSLNGAIERKSQNDEIFASQYLGVVDVNELINQIRYYMSDEDSLDDAAQAQADFDSIGIKPKFTPLSSFQEFYTLPGWDDEIIELIKNEYTTHGSIMFDLNKITENSLRLMFPNITDQEVTDFYEWKNDPEQDRYFNSSDDFKNYVVNIGNIISEDDFKEIIENYKAQGIRFGPSASLFKVISVGNYGRSTYTIEAYISMPAKPYKTMTEEEFKEEKAKCEEIEDQDEKEECLENLGSSMTQEQYEVEVEKCEEKETQEEINSCKEKLQKPEEAESKTLLLKPRVVEIVVS